MNKVWLAGTPTMGKNILTLNNTKTIKIMKKIKHTLLLLGMVTLTNLAFSQSAIEDSIVWDSVGNPLYFKNEIIIKFNPSMVNTQVIDDRSKQSGIVSEFLDTTLLQILIDSGYFTQELLNLSIKKIHHNMTTAETTSVTRIGDTIEIPKFWSTFLIKWHDGAGMAFDMALDTLNKFWPIIEYAHPNYVHQLFTLPNDSRFVSGSQAGLNPTVSVPNASINIDPAWDLTVGSDSCKVGVYDSGINWDHLDFSQNSSKTWSQSRVKGGYNYYGGSSINTTLDTLFDSEGHGTMCAGIIGAIRNNNRGVAGVAGGNAATNSWGVQLYAMKISLYIYIADALVADAVTEGATSSNGTYGFGLHVINNSWGGPKISKLNLDAYRYAFKNDVINACASGNKGNQSVEYPSSLRDEWVLKVGANDNTGNRASFSNYGNSLDFIAPGTGNIYETLDALNDTDYTYNGNGTSEACPHVAGLAALMISYLNTHAAPNKLAPEDAENLMQRYATDIITAPATTNYDIYTGFGRINAGATIQGIRLPRYEVKHYDQTFINSPSISNKILSNTVITLAQGTNGLGIGQYIGDVWEVTRTFNITQPAGRTIVDVWKRNSGSSTLYGSMPIIPETNCEVVLWNQTSATMSAYIYDLKTTISGAGVHQWLPSSGLNGNETMSLTVYSDNPTATDVEKILMEKDFLRVVPNPSNGSFTIMFTLPKPTQMGLEVTDLAGKIVYNSPQQKVVDGYKEILLDLQNLATGVYICNIKTSEGTISQKICIVK